MGRERGSDRIEVELVEDGADPGTPGARPDPGTADDVGTGQRGSGRRARWIGTAVVVALVAVTVGVNVAQARDDAARRAVWAELDWMAPSLAEPLRELWRVPGTGVMLRTDEILVVYDIDSRQQAVRGVDPRSGEVRWEWTGWSGFPDCSLVEGADGVATELACALLPMGVPVEEDEHPTPEVVRLDLDTGEQLAVATAPDAVRGFQPLGEASVTIAGPDVGASVVRITRTGIDPGMAAAVFEVVPGAAWFDASRPWRGRTFAPDEVPGQVQVLDADGTELYSVRGVPVLPWDDDGSGPDVLVVAKAGREGLGSAGLVGVDGATGTELWQGARPIRPEACLQMGELMVGCGSAVTVLDVRTGTVLWQDSTSFVFPVTDGERLLIVRTDRVPREGGMEYVHLLSARDLRSGEVQWDLELPGEVMRMEVHGDVVITEAMEELIAYG